MLWIAGALKQALPTHTSCTHLYLSIYLYYSWRSTRRYRQRLTGMARISTPGNPRENCIAPRKAGICVHIVCQWGGIGRVDAVAGHFADLGLPLSHIVLHRTFRMGNIQDGL